MFICCIALKLYFNAVVGALKYSKMCVSKQNKLKDLVWQKNDLLKEKNIVIWNWLDNEHDDFNDYLRMNSETFEDLLRP